MVTIAELIASKYRTRQGMSEIKGALAVCSMIAVMSRFRKKMFYQLKRERDKLVMSKIKYLTSDSCSARDRLIAAGVIKPLRNDAAY